MLIPLMVAALLASSLDSQSAPQGEPSLDKADIALKDWLSCAESRAISWAVQNERASDLARIATESCSSYRAAYSSSISSPSIDDKAVDRLTQNATDAISNRVARAVLDFRTSRQAK